MIPASLLRSQPPQNQRWEKYWSVPGAKIGDDLVSESFNTKYDLSVLGYGVSQYNASGKKGETRGENPKKKNTKKNQAEIPRPPSLRFTSTIQMVRKSPLSSRPPGLTLIAVQKKGS